jgi:competence protein ComEA
MDTVDSPRTVRPRRERPSDDRDSAAITRERAAVIFGGAGGPPRAAPEQAAGREGAARAGPDRAEPAPTGPEASEPAVPVPGVPVFAGGPLGRMRSWLYVRCGLESKTVVALAVVLTVAGGLAVQHYWAGRPRTVRVPPPVTALPHALPHAPPAREPDLTVDIAGKVAAPGLRRLPRGSRVADALAAAGGPLPGTDTTTLNLARPLNDGEQILVGLPPPLSPPGPGAPEPGTPITPLSLNSATAAQLDALPGVGPVLAQHILDFRAQHGGFTSLQQLRQVPGIGDRKFSTLKPLVHP